MSLYLVQVSVRLHAELEQTEEKRYKLEDEVFCMKEKVRELQTQNKWREARNKTDVTMVSYYYVLIQRQTSKFAN